MADLAFCRMRHLAAVMTAQRAEPNDPAKVFHPSILLDAWSVVDTTHRLRTLLQQMPGMKKSAKDSPKLQFFMRHTEAVASMRNHVQHLNNEIRGLAARGEPVLGVVRWIALGAEDQQPFVSICHLVAGTLFTTGYPPVKLGQIEISPPVDHFTLIAHGIQVSLTDTHQAVDQIAHSIERSLREDLPEGANRGSDLFACIDLRGPDMFPHSEPGAGAPDGGKAT